MKMVMNDLGLLKTEDGHWSIRQVNEQSYAVQCRRDPEDPWGWEHVSFHGTRKEAVDFITWHVLYSKSEW